MERQGAGDRGVALREGMKTKFQRTELPLYNYLF